MLFAHFADCHIGSWRDQKIRELSVNAFAKAVDLCIERGVDFILISGDLFNTSIPSLESLRETVIHLKHLKDKNIPVYAIAGSHDFSPSGKTMLDVLERAGLLTNVVQSSIENGKLKLKFTTDTKTGAKITGILGKKGSLEKECYESLAKEILEQEQGYKIFMFHSAIEEFGHEFEAQQLAALPKGFDYYAGGHVHIVSNKRIEGYGLIAFPGPLFPANFKELEELERGGFYFVSANEGGTSIEFEPIQVCNVYKIQIDAQNRTPQEIEAQIKQEIADKEFNNTIITIRVSGKLNGKASDINFKEIFEILYNKSAYFVMKNTSGLESPEFEEVKVEQASTEEIENALIKEHLQQIKVADLSAEQEEALAKALMQALAVEKEEDERAADFEARLTAAANKVLNLNLI